MINILIGMLWALKLAGVSEMGYQTLAMITITGIVVSAILQTVNERIKKKEALKLTEEINKAADGYQEGITTLLVAILIAMLMK